MGEAGQFDRAIPLLEDLYADDPRTTAFFIQLKEAYTEMKRYDDAIRLVDDRLAHGRTAFLLAERGALLVRKDDVASAMESWYLSRSNGVSLFWSSSSTPTLT